MSKLSRRNLITTGVAAAAGVAGLATAASIARRYGLMPPDSGGLYGPGQSLTYASHRLLTAQSKAREFSRGQISKSPFPNSKPPESADYKRLQAGGFNDWRLAVGGMVASPASLSLSDLRSLPANSQITQLICEEGWSFIAEWIGVRLSDVLSAVGTLPQARYVVYSSIDGDWWDSVDMADALHPQTFLTYAMNDGDLPLGHGGPLRLRVPRQLGYKSVKYITKLTVTDNLKSFGKGLGSPGPEYGYSWYAGI